MSFAQEKKDDGKVTRTRVMKEVQGEITSISKRGISILFNRDEVNGQEDEIMIPMDPKKVQLDHIQQLSQLAIGDIVRVQFEQEDTVGQGKDKTNFRATLISFVRKGKPKPVAQSQTEPQNNQGLGVLDSKE